MSIYGTIGYNITQNQFILEPKFICSPNEINKMINDFLKDNSKI
jgi:hypothetical protein